MFEFSHKYKVLIGVLPLFQNVRCNRKKQFLGFGSEL